MKWFKIKNAVQKVAELFIYGDIEDMKWVNEDVTPAYITDELKKIPEDATDLNVYINSGGGSVFAGAAIFNIIKRLELSVTVYIDGLAASIASVVALAGDRVVMAENALLMIHNPWGCYCGGAEEFRAFADVMDKIKGDVIMPTYAAKTGLSDERLGSMMDEETWMSGKEALELGFIDEMLPPLKVAASLNNGIAKLGGVTHNLSGFNLGKVEAHFQTMGMSLETRQNHRATELDVLAALI